MVSVRAASWGTLPAHGQQRAQLRREREPPKGEEPATSGCISTHLPEKAWL